MPPLCQIGLRLSWSIATDVFSSSRKFVTQNLNTSIATKKLFLFASTRYAIFLHVLKWLKCGNAPKISGQALDYMYGCGNSIMFFKCFQRDNQLNYRNNQQHLKICSSPFSPLSKL